MLALRVAVLMAGAALAQAQPGSRTLFDFEEQGQMAQVSGAAGCQVERVAAPGREGQCLEVAFPGDVDWPFATLMLDAPQDWSGAHWLELDVLNGGTTTRSMAFEVRDSAGHKYQAPRFFPPGEWTRVEILVANMRRGYDSVGWSGEPIDVSAVPSLALVMHPSKTPVTLYFGNVRIVTAEPPGAPQLKASPVGPGDVELRWEPVPGADEVHVFRAEGDSVEASDDSRLIAVSGDVVVDTSTGTGHTYTYVARAFSYRTGDSAVSAPVTVRAQAAKRVGLPDRDQYGGMVGVDREATGYFRTERIGERWWLIDPEGHPYFGLGLCVLGVGDTFTRVTGREDQFADVMPTRDDPAFADAWKPWYGFGPYGLDDSGAVMSRYVLGLMRRYGGDWRSEFCRITAERHAQWGLSMVGAWAADDARQSTHLPYVAFYVPESRTLGGLNLPDPFDPQFERSMADAEAKLAPMRDDPYLIGMFTANEIPWHGAWEKGMSVVDHVQDSPADQPAKRAWVEFLRERYPDIAGLNVAWGTAHDSHDSLLAAQGKVPRTEAADADREEFFRRLLDRYFRLTTEGLKRALPNHLTLGVRIAGNCPRAVDEAMARYLDVISYNIYAPQPLPTGYASFDGLPDRPYLIGEFAARGDDAGLPNAKGAGDRVPTQADRGWYYQRYLAAAERSTHIVGVTWFQYIDQSATGRFGDGVDGGENSNYGWVNLRDEPYEGFVRMATLANANIYITAPPTE